jgi:hypothetical protein
MFASCDIPHKGSGSYTGWPRVRETAVLPVRGLGESVQFLAA